MLKKYIDIIKSGNSLTVAEAENALTFIMEGTADENEIEELLVGLAEKGEEVSEIVGFAKIMRKHSNKVKLGIEGILDTCGTGGDGGVTFNISTAVAFVVAAAGVPVAKHGNRAVSGKSGSIDVLESLGINVNLDINQCVEIFNCTNLVFLFAQRHHPAMKYIAPIRKKISRRTIFNMLGPITNPAGASYQIIGVYSEAVADKIAEALRQLDCQKAMIVHSHSGLDELSVDGANTIIELNKGNLIKYQITPEDVGIKKSPLSEVSGGTPEQNAKTIVDIFEGNNKGTDYDMVVLNAGAALYVANKVETLKTGVEMAKTVIDQGTAFALYDQYKRLSNELRK